MGRMLETLKLGEGRRASQAIIQPASSPPVQECVVDWEIGAEVPFVEVGGPGKKVELSPSLLVHPPQVVPQAPHLLVEPNVKPEPQAVHLTAVPPLSATFEAWPGPAPRIAVSSEIIAYHQPDHAASKAYGALLDAMCQNLKTDVGNVLLLIGLKPAAGVSTVLLNLAVRAALRPLNRVIVVDAGGPHTNLAQPLGLTAPAGIAEVLDGTVALEQAIVKTEIGTLHLLPAGAAPTKPATREAMTWLTTWLRGRYDLIFIAGATAADANALALQAPHADGIYLVLPPSDVETLDKNLAQTINRMGGRLCGLIHTRYDR